MLFGKLGRLVKEERKLVHTSGKVQGRPPVVNKRSIARGEYLG